MICEKCWGDAYLMMRNTGRDQYDCYRELLHERRDEMNAQIHMAKSIRYSPITSTVEAAYDRCVQILVENGIEPEGRKDE